MASTITSFTDTQTEAVQLGTEKCVAQQEIDFSIYNAGSGDTVQCLKVPANALVTRVDVVVKTAEGATATATVGDGTDPNGWDASTNLNAAAGTLTSPTQGTDAYAYGKFYTAADTIDLVVSAALDTAVVVVTAEYQIIEKYA